MILIVEPVHFGDTHVQVNSAFVALFQKVYEGEKVLLIAEQKHIDAIKSNAAGLADCVLTESFINYNKNASGFYWFRKIAGEWLQIIKVFYNAKKTKPEILVWLSLFPTGHLLVNILSRLFFVKQKQYIVLHAELEYLKEVNKKKSDQILSLILRKSLKLAGLNTEYIVLGQSIKNKLVELLPANRHQFHTMPHPYLYSSYTKKTLGSPLRICTFGILNKSKNAHLFFDLAASFQKEILDGKISFHTVGKLFDELKPFTNNWVNCYKPEEFLPQDEFENTLALNDVAVFFYDKTQYSLSASGALHEALNLQMPVFALENRYFQSVDQEQKIINLVPDLIALKTEIKMLLNNPQLNFLSFEKRIIMFLEQNSFLLQSERLRNLLHNDAR